MKADLSNFASTKGLWVSFLVALLLHGAIWLLGQDLLSLLKESPTPPPKQVVQITLLSKTPPPKKAQFLAEHNQSFKRETKALGNKKPKASPILPVPKKHQLSMADLMPTPETLMGTFSSSEPPGNQEVLEEVAQGAQTLLNTFEWKHASFFNRIKQSVSETWDPNMALRRFDPQGMMLGEQSKTTVLLVTLNPKGQLTQVQVASPSGVDYLDDEAIRSFVDAAPFLNPPPVLFKHKEEFSFRFSFIVEYKKGFQFNLDWMPN